MRFFKKILDLLYPPKCVFCHRLLENCEENICPSCSASLPFTTEASGKTTGDFFIRCISPLQYKDNVREAIHRYKFSGMESYGTAFGGLMADCAEERITSHIDVITWVPLSRRRKASRGYDQAKILADEISRRSGIPCTPLLKKVRNTKAQSSLSDKSKRKANIAGAYIVTKAADVKNKSILLVDDVVTTASTLSECSRILLMSGADSIMCITLAKAGK